MSIHAQRSLTEQMPITASSGLETRLPELKTYDEYKTIGMSYRKGCDQNDWDLGDLVVEVVYLSEISKLKVIDLEDNNETPDEDLLAIAAEKNIINKFADDIGWTRDHLVARKRVAERFGKDHWIRRSSLTFSHARILNAVKDDKTLDVWARRVIEEKIAVHALSGLLKEELKKENVKAGQFSCETCRETIDNADVMVTLEQKGSKFHTCNWACAAQFSLKMVGTKVPDIDQDLELDDLELEEEIQDLVEV